MGKIPESELVLNKDGSVYHLSLLPKHISDVIIAVGDPSRVYMVSKYFDKLDFEMNKREFITHVGKFKGKQVTVISTGIGTDNVEIFFNEIDALVNIDLKKREPKKRRRKLKVIRIGTSGALQEDIAVGTHLVSDYAVGLDNMLSFYDLPQSEYEKNIAVGIRKQCQLEFDPYVARASQELKSQIGADMIEGNTVTCPGFYAPQGRVLRLRPKNPRLLDQLNYYHHEGLWLTNFEMETAAYYALGKLLGHEVLSVNAIIANRIKKRFSKNSLKVVDSLIQKVLERI